MPVKPFTMLGCLKILAIFMQALLIFLPVKAYSDTHAEEANVDKHEVRAFLQAAHANDVGTLRQGIDAGVPVDSKDSHGRTALLIATHHSAVEAARILIRAGADVNAKDSLQDSPFLYAGAEGELEILQLTVDAGADLSSVNRYGGTALIPAAHHGHDDVVRYLLTTEIDIDHVNHLGWTALLEAVILGDGGPTHQQIVKLLLDAKSDATIPDKQGKTAMDHAKARGQAQVARLLEKRGDQ